VIASALYADRTFGLAQTVYAPMDLKDHKLLILHGGEDISPSLYGERASRAFAGNKPSKRDEAEVAIAQRAMELGMPILGICRGAQLMCALAGGRLWQHVTNHHGDHTLDYKGHKVVGNSCHHQMMIPTMEMETLAYSDCLSPQKWGQDAEPYFDEEPEPEIVYMPNQKALAVQGHPEWLNSTHPFVKLVKQLVNEKLCNSL
jgi:gamma-glutamyl-gamma-aminobutyrate hydrolase PuuD